MEQRQSNNPSKGINRVGDTSLKEAATTRKIKKAKARLHLKSLVMHIVRWKAVSMGVLEHHEVLTDVCIKGYAAINDAWD
ncbi:MAG: hypothetical protein WKG06_26815 [Segetibacter sp.]